MKFALKSILFMLVAKMAFATSTLERNLVECPISTRHSFEEIILKFVAKEDNAGQRFEDFVLDYTFGSYQTIETDLLGNHEQVRERIFTSSNAAADGLISEYDDFKMISQFNGSELRVNLRYDGQNSDGMTRYLMTLDGYGPVFNLVYDKYRDILRNSEHYSANDPVLCTTNFDLRDFVNN